MASNTFYKVFFIIGFIVAQMLGVTPAKADNKVERGYEVSDFSAIHFEGGYNVVLSQGSSEKLVMKTTPSLHDKVKIYVSDDVLYIKTKIKNIQNSDIKLEITFKSLEKLEIEGGMRLRTLGYLDFDDLTMKVEGGADIKMSLKANEINAHAEGGVNMEFEGIAKSFVATCEGAANIDADQLKCEWVKCRVSGVGNATVYATDELTATVEGVGKIGYRGDPDVNKRVNGIGLVYKK